MIFLAIMFTALPLVIVGAMLDERRDQRRRAADLACRGDNDERVERHLTF